jgi:hypothetical protein
VSENSGAPLNVPILVDGRAEPTLLTVAEWQLINNVLGWLRTPILQEPAYVSMQGSGGFEPNQVFCDAFALRLRLFHSLHSPSEAMAKKAFEFAFEFAASAAGYVSTLDPSDTTAGADLIVAGERISLKTEGSKDILRDYITISKLMESLWTKHCNSVDDFLAGVNTQVVPRLMLADRCFILRSFGRLASSQTITYQLLEIPMQLLLAMRKLQVADFKKITRAKGTSAVVRHLGQAAYTLALDGSDQKITIRRLAVALCRPVASWTVRANSAAPNEA